MSLRMNALRRIKMKIDGRCHCGYITFEAEIEPDKTLLCNCTDCQTFSGSAFRVHAFTREDAFTLLSGEPKIYVKTAESGNKRPQAFCPECGTHIYATAVGAGPKVYAIRVDSIRQRDQIVPIRNGGLAPRSHGSHTSGRCERSRSSLRSIKPAINLDLMAVGRSGRTDRSAFGPKRR